MFGFKIVWLFKRIFMVVMWLLVEVSRSVVLLFLFFWFILVFSLRNIWIKLEVFVLVVNIKGVVISVWNVNFSFYLEKDWICFFVKMDILIVK